MNSEVTKEIPALDPMKGWQPLAPGACNVFIALAFAWTFTIALVPTSIFAIAEDDSPWLYFFGALALALMVASAAAFVAFKRWRNTYWKLDDEALHVRRGKMWFKQICLPRSRVQHLDFERGPLERRYGLATLVVHTAGSHERALRQSGLLLADAEYLRDALVPKDRRHDE
ncbi:MAG: PH domain-containing protein [Arenimonas sp.]